MSLAVEFHDDARAEVLAAHAWYVARSPAAADAFIVELERAVELICDAPEAWSPHLYGTRKHVFRRLPYSVIYRIVGETLEVIAVAHQRRRPGYWRGR
jgi:toxin ParE1/3/4